MLVCVLCLHLTDSALQMSNQKSDSSREAQREDFSHTEKQLCRIVDGKHLIQCTATESIPENWDSMKRQTEKTEEDK